MGAQGGHGVHEYAVSRMPKTLDSTKEKQKSLVFTRLFQKVGVTGFEPAASIAISLDFTGLFHFFGEKMVKI